MILLFTAGTAFATFNVVREIPSVYESQAVLVVSEHAARDAVAMNSRISTAKQRALSASSLEPLIERYHLKGTAESIDGAIQRLRKEIKVETKLSDSYPQLPEIVSISYRLHDPKLAQQVVTEVVSTFEQTNDAITRRTAIEADSLDSQIAELEGQMAGLSLPDAALVPGPIGAAGDPEPARLALVSAVDSLNDKTYALEQQIAEQKRQIVEQGRIDEAAKSTAGPPDAAYGALLVRKAELNAQLSDYASQYTDKNAKVVQARAQLSEINSQLAALEAKRQPGSVAVSPANQERLALERDLIRLQTELELVRRELGRKKAALGALPRASASANGATDPNRSKAEAAASYNRLVKQYDSLLEQRAQMKKTFISDAEDPPLFQVIDPPNLPQQPVGPNPPMLRGLALALALGAGLLVAAIAEGRKLFFIHDHRDVAYFLGVPLLAAIPETLTPLERSLKWRHMLASKLGILLLAAAIPATVLVVKHFGLLHIVVPSLLR